MTQHSATYEKRLASSAWRQLREAVITKQGGRCDRCSRRQDHPTGTPLEVHHLHYRTLGHESVSDLVALCKYCHKVADKERTRRTAADVWAARVDGWAAKVGMDPDDAATEEAFATWLEGQEP